MIIICMAAVVPPVYVKSRSVDDGMNYIPSNVLKDSSNHIPLQIRNNNTGVNPTSNIEELENGKIIPFNLF